MYANLRGGEDGNAADPASVLAGFLQELDVDGRDIPENLNERARMYRTLLAGQRVLLVLDNAVDETQVRPLLPGEVGCAVLLTSRSRLAGLGQAHAEPAAHAPAAIPHPTETEIGPFAAVIADERSVGLVRGSYPYDSDPAGTTTRPLARPLTMKIGRCDRDDRARLAGSLALTSEPTRTTFLRQATQADLLGNPAAD